MKLKIFALLILFGLCNSQNVPADICQGFDLAFLPYPNDCTQFILCVWELPSFHRCRWGEIFDPSQLICVPGDAVSCEVFTTTQGIPTFPTISPTPTLPSGTPTLPSISPTLPSITPSFTLPTTMPIGTTPPPDTTVSFNFTIPTSFPWPITTSTMPIATTPSPTFPSGPTIPSIPTLPSIPTIPSIPSVPSLPTTTTVAIGTTPPPVTTTTQRPPGNPALCLNNNFRFVADPTCCYCYYYCMFDLPVPGTCTEDRIFSERLRGCVIGDQATCTPNFPININTTTIRPWGL